jgi:hypothetical protein
MSATEAQELEVIEGTALEPYQPPAPSTLFRTDDPVEVVERATKAADALASVIEQRKLYAQIQGKKHIVVEGWQTLGAMLGVTPVCTWTRLVSEPAKGWEARVEARTLDGRVIGAAEGECLRSERRWANADDFAVRSMAQTRAMSKALSSVLRFVVTLAGYQGTPAEEMPRDQGEPVQEVSSRPAPQAAPVQPTQRQATAKQKGLLNAKAAEAKLSSVQFGNCILRAQGKPVVPELPEDDEGCFDQQQRAGRFLNRTVDRLPASLVDRVLEEIEKAAK